MSRLKKGRRNRNFSNCQTEKKGRGKSLYNTTKKKNEITFEYHSLKNEGQGGKRGGEEGGV